MTPRLSKEVVTVNGPAPYNLKGPLLTDPLLELRKSEVLRKAEGQMEQQRREDKGALESWKLDRDHDEIEARAASEAAKAAAASKEQLLESRTKEALDRDHDEI